MRFQSTISTLILRLKAVVCENNTFSNFQIVDIFQDSIYQELDF